MWMPLGWVSASGAAPAAASFELISTSLISVSTTSVTFTLSAAQQAAYKHLQFRITDRSTASINSQLALRFNGDSGSNYSEHQIAASGSGTPGAYGGASVTQAPMGSGAESGFTANGFNGRIIDILDVSSTTKNKTVRELSGFSGSSNRIGLYSAGWYSTSAITSIEVLMSGGQFAANSRISLYGVRG